MKVSGAAIIRNGVKLRYPFIESIKSVLPLCFEFIIGVGDCEDDTREKIEAIGDSKIKIIDTKWSLRNRSGGEILSEKTNEILEKCNGDWIFYIQSDEAINEKDYDKIRESLLMAEKNPKVDGLIFNYLHFYGSYSTIQPGRNWYAQEIRIIRNHRDIKSYGDAQGFRKNDDKICGIETGAKVYHYGWARPPEIMIEKIKSFHKFWHDDAWIKNNCSGNNIRDYFSDLGNLKEYKDDHPLVMNEIIKDNSSKFISECRKEYIKKRSLKQYFVDLSRKMSFLGHKNFKKIKI